MVSETYVWKVGDRVEVAPRNREDWTLGTVTAIDEDGLPRGVRVTFDRPYYVGSDRIDNCYASHGELRPSDDDGK